MARHRADGLSMFFGVLFALTGGLYLASDAGGLRVDLHWVLPAALIALGLLGLAGSLRRPPSGS